MGAVALDARVKPEHDGQREGKTKGRQKCRPLRSCEAQPAGRAEAYRSEEHTSELQSLMRISYAVFCLKKKKSPNQITYIHKQHTPHDTDQRRTNHHTNPCCATINSYNN